LRFASGLIRVGKQFIGISRPEAIQVWRSIRAAKPTEFGGEAVILRSGDRDGEKSRRADAAEAQYGGGNRANKRGSHDREAVADPGAGKKRTRQSGATV
jgi:hypothetical protein